MSIHAGIDIAARTFVLAWRVDGRLAGTREFSQGAAGHGAAAALLGELGAERVVLEATGVYYLDLAWALAEAGLPVAVINPRRFHHFAALRDIGRQINHLTRARTQAKNRLHALKAPATTPALLIRDERAGIAALDRRIVQLSEAAAELISAEPALAQTLTHLQAVKGIGLASALALLAELAVLPAELKAKQVARHAGLDVRLTQSGTSVDKPGRLSKTGNAYLRTALYMPALSAARHDPYARAFYQALIQRGKKKMQALCALMRKYLTGLWACIKAGEPFDSSRLFSPIHLQQTGQ